MFHSCSWWTSLMRVFEAALVREWSWGPKRSESGEISVSKNWQVSIWFRGCCGVLRVFWVWGGGLFFFFLTEGGWGLSFEVSPPVWENHFVLPGLECTTHLEHMQKSRVFTHPWALVIWRTKIWHTHYRGVCLAHALTKFMAFLLRRLTVAVTTSIACSSELPTNVT